jgi:hypothetical protein
VQQWFKDRNIFMATAEIHWLQAAEGGRLNPPSGPQYSTVARFEDQTDEEWARESWSVVLDFQGSPNESGHQIVTVRFLSENSPSQWLSPSKSFALFEGTKKVAEGTVLANNDNYFSLKPHG